MSLEVTGYRASEHSRETIDSALIALVFSNGNCRKAAQAVNEQLGTNIHHATVGDWRRKYQDRWLEIRDQIEPKVRATLAARHEDSALKALDKVDQALEAIDITQLSQSELGKMTQNLAVSSGIFTDKASTLRGRPTEITEHRHALEVFSKLKNLSNSLIVEGTAEEVEDAELVEPTADDADRRQQRA